MPDIPFSLPASFTTQHPVVLFPVRIQVKFVHTDSAAYELRVRIYPDQLGLSTHEEELTTAEVDDGKNYWEKAPLENPRKLHSLDHWRPLVAKYGAPRARWILLKTTPNKESDLEQHDSSWTRAAHTLIMPDQFTVVLYNQIQEPAELPALVHEQLFTGPNRSYDPGTIINPTSEFLKQVRIEHGRPIPAGPLSVGFDPQSDEPNDMTGLDKGNQWTVDFNMALEKGMAISIPLSETEYNQGFKRLVVIGVSKTPPADNQKLLEQVLTDHMYTDGFELIPQGTPTNNTDTGDAGYSSLEHYDADTSFELLLSEKMFEPAKAGALQPDGQRLTQALGIDPNAIGPVPHAHKTDISDAQLMNRALWPATYGYFLDEMLRSTKPPDDLLSGETKLLVRKFFESHVLARGQAPAFRVGNEPYGILPTTRFSAWKTGDGFGQQLSDLLNHLDVTWTERLNPQPGLYPTKLSTGSSGTEVGFAPAPSSQQNLLSTLAADATSVEYYQRYMLGPVLTDTLSEFGKSQNVSIWTEQRGEGRFGTQAVPENPLYAEFRRLLDPADRLNLPEAWPKIYDQTFQSTLTKVADAFADEPAERRGLGTLINEQPLSENRGVTSDKGFNYITWLATSSFDKIRLENFTIESEMDPAFTAPNSLLYHLLRQAVLLQYWEAARKSGQVTIADSEEKELFGIGSQADKARWEWLYEQGPDQKPLHEFLKETPGELANYLADLQEMASFSTAHLERLLAEHLDLGSYRIDAWKIAQVAKRLTELRQDYATRMGSYLGAFAWLEDVQQTDHSVPVDAAGRFDPDNLGYIHSPTLNHGTAAAILRQGYKSRQMTTDTNDPAANRMAVNLSSRRVRKALAVLEGLQQGHSLGTMLGQEFERSLHQTEALVGNKPYGYYITIFRKAYPIAAEKILNSKESASGPGTDQAARQVVDGMALLRETTGVYPYRMPDLPIDANFSAFVAEQLASLTDTLDALGDLTVSEGVYQAAQGNMDRAAAILESVAKGQFPVNPEIVHPPHMGNTVTHRVLVHLPANTTLVAWPDVKTPRAWAEPHLNAWLAQFFPSPDLVQIGFGYPKKGEGEWPVDHALSLHSTGLHPIDLLILLDANALQAGSAFDLLVRHTIDINPVQEKRPADSVLVINYQSSGAKSLRSLLPLMNRLRQLLGASRNALPNDLQVPGTVSAEETENPYSVDKSLDVHGRVLAGLSALIEIKQALASLPTTDNALTSSEAVPVWQAVLFGVTEAIAALPAITGASAAVVRAAINTRIQEAQQSLNAITGSNWGEKYAEASQALFGPSFRLSIEFTLPADASNRYQNATTSAAASSLLRYGTGMHNADDINPLPMQEWLQGIACVRDTMDHLDKVLLIHSLVADDQASLPQLQPAQLSVNMPVNPGANPATDPYWLGQQWPEKYKPDGDAISLVQWLPAGYSSAGTQYALWVDEWTETIPEPEENTALTFHYDQPNTEPPQTVLLVVSPQTTGWTGEDLLGAVNETLDMAKKRTVEPDSLAFTHLGTLLPAVVAPVAQQAVTFTLDFGKLNDSARFEQQPLTP